MLDQNAVDAEMSAINPVVLLPVAMAARGGAIGRAFVAAMTLGAGQFCTSPGLVLALDGPGLDEFLRSAAAAVASAPASTMLTQGILENYRSKVEALSRCSGVSLVAEGLAGGDRQGRAGLFASSTHTLRSDRILQTKVFGPASLVVRCADVKSLREALEEMEGQLTISVHADEGDYDIARSLLPILERKAGRIVFNGFGTGVEVGHAMVHGGPYPATSDSRFTSVGSLAIRRFLRPVCYQDLPSAVRPAVLGRDSRQERS